MDFVFNSKETFIYLYAQGVTRFLYLNIKVSIMKYRTKKKLVNFVFNNREAFIYLYAQGVTKLFQSIGQAL
mgnify:CR=1 FL=1